MIDYRALLAKYMQHVHDCEGITYLDFIPHPGSAPTVSFALEEVAMLEAIEAENRQDRDAEGK
jgi:hypothetical protein